MASKRAKRRRQCSRKVGHADLEGALIARGKMIRHKRAGAVDLRAYRCCHCGKWHLGHPSARIRDAIEQRQEQRGPARFG